MATNFIPRVGNNSNLTYSEHFARILYEFSLGKLRAYKTFKSLHKTKLFAVL